MAIEDLEKALDLITFKFLTSFWLFLANKNKASKDIYNVSLHQLCEKNTKLENCWFLGYFRNMKESAVFMKELAKNGQLEKHFFFTFSKKLRAKVPYQNRFFDFFHPHWVSVYTRVENR